MRGTQIRQRLLEKSSLPRPGAGNQADYAYARVAKALAQLARDQVVLLQDIAPDFHQPGLAHTRHSHRTAATRSCATSCSLTFELLVQFLASWQEPPTPSCAGSTGRDSSFSYTHGVSGEAIELEGGDVHAFSVAPAGLLVEWSTEPPGLGNIDQHGIYHAPAVVDTLRSVVVVAKTPGGAQFGTATITLSDAPRAIGRLGRFGVVVAAVLAIALVYLWSALNVKPRQPMVVIAPPEYSRSRAGSERLRLRCDGLR